MIRDRVISGIHIGEHSFDADAVIEEIKERCIKRGMNFVTIRTSVELIKKEYFIKWAKFLAENKIYFMFLYTIQHAPEGRESQFDAETVSVIKKIAGEYFIGDMLGETGSQYACKFAGYYKKRKDKKIVATTLGDVSDMREAHESYIKEVSKYVEIDRKLGMPEIVSCEATCLNKYNVEAGVTMPMLELMCGYPDVLVSSLRGLARACDAKLWGTYIAHEWYGGMRHSDMLKRKRLELAYKYAYLAGSNVFCLESGDEQISSYGYEYQHDSEICGDYIRVLGDFSRYINEDERPAGGPKARVAFVQGNHDAWGGWGGSSLWNQFGKKEWGHDAAEYGWRILYEIGMKRTWYDISNYGDNDVSMSPAYGMYDIVPVEASTEKLCKYDYLIFAGWNTMTDEIFEKLCEYVKNGGRLLMTAAHLNRNPTRGGEAEYIENEKLEKLFGCRITGESITTNDGIKLEAESLMEDVLYPGAKSKICDPIYSAGYVRYLKCDVGSGRVVGELSENFADIPSGFPVVIENKLGKGVATLIACEDYPGHLAVYPLYRDMVREFISASARNCDIRVLSSDRLRYSVYEGGKMYLLNTDYDMSIEVKIIVRDKTYTEWLEPLEMKTLSIEYIP